MNDVKSMTKAVSSLKNATCMQKDYRLVGGAFQKDGLAFLKDVEKKATQQKKNIITIFAVISD